jgi:hypothetical protein
MGERMGDSTLIIFDLDCDIDIHADAEVTLDAEVDQMQPFDLVTCAVTQRVLD